MVNLKCQVVPGLKYQCKLAAGVFTKKRQLFLGRDKGSEQRSMKMSSGTSLKYQCKLAAGLFPKSVNFY